MIPSPLPPSACLLYTSLLRDIKKDHVIIFSTHILQLATDLCDEIVILNGGALSQMDTALLHSKEFEEKIIEILRDPPHQPEAPPAAAASPKSAFSLRGKRR